MWLDLDFRIYHHTARSFWFSAPSYQLQMAEENHADSRLSRLLLPQARFSDEEIAATEVDVSVFFFMTPTVTRRGVDILRLVQA
jgi:hypothetical protein